MLTGQATTSVMEQLKTSTLEQHQAAESHPFQRNLAAGKLPREQYIANLGQLLLLHKALEAGLRASISRVPAIARVVREYQYQEPYLLEDLKFFGVDPTSVRPTSATRALVSAIQQYQASAPLKLLGMHYVLEGSNNGSKFICRSVRRAYGLEGVSGNRYMDPYGDQQRAYWELFKQDMNAQNFAQPQIDELIAGAREMFDAISAVGQDLLEAAPSAS